MRSKVIKVGERNSRDASTSAHLKQIEKLEQQIHSLIEISSDFYWELDTELRLTTVRGPEPDSAGFDKSLLIGKRHWELSSVVPVSDGGRWDEQIARMKAHQAFDGFIYRYLTFKGEQRYVKISGKPMFDNAGRFVGYRGITKDITRGLLVEQRVSVEQSIARILTTADSVSEAASCILRAVCETLGWACGARWVLDEHTGELRCAETWGVETPPIQAFLTATRALRTFPVASEGLVRRTYVAGEPQWIRNVTKEKSFLRATAAADAQLRSAFALPIKVGARVIGVIEFYSQEAPHTADDELLRGAAYIGDSIGQFCRRKQAEDDLVRFRAALDVSGDSIYLVDRATMRYVDCNETACKLTGYTREELLSRGPFDLSPTMDPKEFERAYDEAIANPDKIFKAELITKTKNSRGYAETQRRAIRIGDRWIIVSIARDITLRKRTEQAALRLRRMYAVLGATNEAIMRAKSMDELYQRVCDAAVASGQFLLTAVLTPDSETAVANITAVAGQGARRLRDTHISVDPRSDDGQGLVGTAFRTRTACISNDFLKDERTKHWHAQAQSGKIAAGAAVPLVKDDNALGVLLFYSGERFAFDEEVVKLLERMAENIVFGFDNFEREAERKRGQERIQYLATHDGLTGLPNRLMFNELLNLAIESARRYKRQFAVLFIDLDRFKLINDTLGHQAGDVLLKEMSSRLKDCLRASDVVARLGGDEFVVLVQETRDSDHVATVARKILSVVMAPMEILGHECRVTASIGIALYPADAEDEQSLMKNADIAMYLAKEEGKNNFQFYSKEIKALSLEHMALETQLRRALECNEFTLNYQAKLDLKTDTITGVEALLRWSNPELGSVSPMQFIPVAEETGLIVPIGRWVLKTACEQNVAWQNQGLPPVCMAVNLSPRQFADPDLLKDIAATLEETGLRPELLELEITESMVMHNTERAVKLLTAIKEMGVRLAIDDFGTGYSSLAQLKRFPIDTLKVDRSFIREIPKDTEDRAITEAIIAMGKSLSLTIVAEGVETAEQQSFLRERACDEMQGYYFSKPIEAGKFAELLRGHESLASA